MFVEWWFLEFLQFFPILAIFHLLVISNLYTLCIASGHNEFGSHFAAADVENVWL